jgi:hypothetical protein
MEIRFGQDMKKVEHAEAAGSDTKRMVPGFLVVFIYD